MLLLLAKSPSSVDVIPHRKHPNLGTLVTPSNGAIPVPSIPWACDNDAFNGFSETTFVTMLNRVQGVDGCLWVAAPDVVGDAEATLAQFDDWRAEIVDRNYPVALVGQDGMTLGDVPWPNIDCLFIGGSTEWKLGPEARQLVREAVARDKLVHMGRVNSWKRIRYAGAIGCDSFDGTKFTRFTNLYLERALEVTSQSQQTIMDLEA